MPIDRLLPCCISLFIVIHAITRSVASQQPRDSLFGVSPQDVKYYKGLFSSSSIKCKDGSNKFDKSQFNDDFCDCPDGSDEPGTSACPNGKFYCRNAGHTPIILYSSRVNDGICDCCDGSDEYNGKMKCQNTCWEAGKVAREKLRKKIATYKEGIAMRKKEIEQAKTAITKDEGELSKLKDEEKTLKPLVEKLKERKEQIEKAEEEERQRKEKEEKERKEAQEAKEKEGKVEEHLQSDVLDTAGTTDQSQEDLKKDSHESVHEPELVDHSSREELPHDEVGEVYKDSHQNVEQAGDSTDDDKAGLDTSIRGSNTAEGSDSLSKEELGRLVASRWTGEKTEQGKEEESDASSDKDNQNPGETQNEANDEEDNGYHTEDDEHRYDDIDDDDDNYDQNDDLSREDQINQYDSSSSHNVESDGESDFTDTTTASSLSWLEKLNKKVKNMFQAVNLFQTPVNVSDAAHVRKEYDEASAKLSKIQSRISKLTQKLGQDFGPEKEFYSFYGQCFESKQNKYVYKVCPFKQATQEEGYSTTRLGSWDKFEDSYRSMQFSNGDKCWNGPDRSLKVQLRCGLKNELTDVDEPSRCEYLARLGTPTVCLESKLKELEEKLEGMNVNEAKAEAHDEL